MPDTHDRVLIPVSVRLRPKPSHEEIHHQCSAPEEEQHDEQAQKCKQHVHHHLPPLLYRPNQLNRKTGSFWYASANSSKRLAVGESTINTLM